MASNRSQLPGVVGRDDAENNGKDDNGENESADICAANPFSRRRRLFLVVLFDILFALVLFIVFLIFLAAAADETKYAVVASRLDFVRLLPRLDAGSCFFPVLSLDRSETVAVAPHHRRVVEEVQAVLLKQSNDDLVRLFSTCEPEVALQICLLKKTCPHFVNNRDDFDDVTIQRFDLGKSKAKRRRANFVDNSNFSDDLDFCNALFSYVLLTTSFPQTSELALNYTLSLDEPHEVEHLLLIFLSAPEFIGIRLRARCGRSDIQCLLAKMCEYEVYQASFNDTGRDDWKLFQTFMEDMLSTCNGEPCKTNKWVGSDARGWFSSCWLRRGRFHFVIPWNRVNVSVPVFRRPCDEARWARDYSVIFGVAGVYIFVLALLFLFLEFAVLFLYRRFAADRRRVARLASVKILLASSASIVPSSLRPSRGTTPRSTPRGSQRSFSDNRRGRFGRGPRRLGGGQGDQFSVFGSLTGISNAQSSSSSSARSVDSGLGFNTRLSTPRSASIPHLRVAQQHGLLGGRLKAYNDYVFPAFESSSMSVLPTPITRPPTVRRSFSTREEPVLNFLGEAVIDGGGEILERVDQDAAEVDVVEASRPPRPASTPITQQQQQQRQQTQPPPLEGRRRNHQRRPSSAHHSLANHSSSAIQLDQQEPLRERHPPTYDGLSFAAFDGDATGFIDRSTVASWRDSGVETSHASDA